MPSHRFQIYVVARGRKANYRVLAAFDHRSLHGVHAVLRVSSIVREVVRNAKVVTQELTCLEDESYTLKDAPVPCPFLWNRLHRWNGKAGTVGSQNPQQQANDDGVAVIDVSDPLEPSLCFLNLGNGESHLQGLGVWQPLSAEQYIQAYHKCNPLNDDEADRNKYAQSLIIRLGLSELSSFRLLDQMVVDNTWPDNAIPAQNPFDKKGKKATHQPLALLQDRSDWYSRPLSEVRGTSPKLRSLMEKFASRRQQEGIKAPLEIPADLLDRLVVAIKDEVARSDDPSFLDLSGSPFSSDHIIRILSDLPDVTSLDLSRCPQITAEALACILTSREQPFRRLILLHMPQLHVFQDDGVTLEGLRDGGLFASEESTTEVISTEWERQAAVKARDASEKRTLGDSERETTMRSLLGSLGMDLEGLLKK